MNTDILVFQDRRAKSVWTVTGASSGKTAIAAVAAHTNSPRYIFRAKATKNAYRVTRVKAPKTPHSRQLSPDWLARAQRVYTSLSSAAPRFSHADLEQLRLALSALHSIGSARTNAEALKLMRTAEQHILYALGTREPRNRNG